MATNKNYSVTLSGLLDTSKIESQIKALQAKQKGITFTADTSGIKSTTTAVNGLDTALQNSNASATDNLLTFQAANLIFRKTVEVIGEMVDQVYELNAAETEFKKVSDLSGSSLDNYVDKLSKTGSEVARTGWNKI